LSDSQETEEMLVLSVRRVPKELQVSRDPKDLKDLKDNKEHQELLAKPVQLAKSGKLDNLVNEEK